MLQGEPEGPCDRRRQGAAAGLGVERELAAFDPELARRDRWLVPTKLDLVPPAERAGAVAALVEGVGWGGGPVYPISALAREGTDTLSEALMRRLEDEG